MKNFFVAWLFLLFSINVWAETNTNLDMDKFKYPIYIGASGGYGSTTWSWLVPPANRASVAMALSTPISVSEGGKVWGLFLGYEFIPQFALEGNYQRYQQAFIYFSKRSLFAFQNNGLQGFNTNTESYSLSGKFMVFIPYTTIRAYSSVGAAAVHRTDMLTNRWQAEPTFGLGLNYVFNPHCMGEIGANYTGGYGESEIQPVNDFVPFTYSVFVRLAYRL